MSGYRLPSPTDWVTASWQSHKDRTPPSSEPGTDYGAAYGAEVYAVAAGVVTYVKTTNSGGMGRVVEYALSDGRTSRSLHLSQVYAWVGQSVMAGTVLGRSGASGNGSDWWYGPHVHQTLWDGPAWAAPTIDFEPHVGAPTPPPEPEPEPPDEGDEDVKGLFYTNAAGTNIFMLFNEVSGFYAEHSGVDAAYNNEIAISWDTGAWPRLTEGHVKNIKKALDRVSA